MKHPHLAAAVSACLLLAACSENGGTPPGGVANPQSGDAGLTPPAVEQPVAPQPPSGPLFVPSAETQDGLAAKANAGVCSVENVVIAPDGAAATSDKPNTYQVTRDAVYRMVGFAVNKDKGIVPADIEIVLTGDKSYALKSTTGGDREDVAKFFGNPAFGKAGFMQDASFKDVAPGEYAIYVVSSDGGETAVCPTHQGVIVP